MAKKQKMLAIDLTRNTTVTCTAGGSIDVEKGDVLIVNRDVSSEDALFLCAIKKAVPCEPALKGKREKEKVARLKAEAEGSEAK